ncbi:MAG: hypothetical protein GY879_12605 [Planctomycetes bacterium]|nr:hypothetical protein [Planctomycetota bacterium]
MTNSSFGYCVSGAGDVNHDGYADVIIGAPMHSPGGGRKFAGEVRVYSGATNSLLYSYTGPFQGFGLGVAVSGAGDVNKDGFGDFRFVCYSTDNTG